MMMLDLLERGFKRTEISLNVDRYPPMDDEKLVLTLSYFCTSAKRATFACLQEFKAMRMLGVLFARSYLQLN